MLNLDLPWYVKIIKNPESFEGGYLSKGGGRGMVLQFTFLSSQERWKMCSLSWDASCTQPYK